MCCCAPPALWRSRGHRWFLQGLLTLSVFVMLFTAVAEWLFWDEFGVRFNFIAVDYLVYSDEVLNNILESYPIGKLLGALAAIAIVMCIALHKPLQRVIGAPLPSWRQRLLSIGVIVALSLGVLLVVDQDTPRGKGGNTYQHELASNGPYQFFAAFRNNELDYDQFYGTLPNDVVARHIHQELAERDVQFIQKDSLDVRRTVTQRDQTRRHNIILVTIESFSAKYMGSNQNHAGRSPIIKSRMAWMARSRALCNMAGDSIGGCRGPSAKGITPSAICACSNCRSRLITPPDTSLK